MTALEEAQREHPMPGQTLRYVDFSGGYDGARPVVSELETANLVTSESVGERHRVVLDIDLPAKLIPSSTPGHSHLYINHEMSWEDYTRLLNVLAEVGIVEPGYVRASLDRGYTAVRLPWIKKPGT